MIALLSLYLATLQNIRTKTDAWRLFLFIAFSSFQHLTAVPYQEAKKRRRRRRRRRRKRRRTVYKNNNKTHELEPLV
jgi:hypothetical protein